MQPATNVIPEMDTEKLRAYCDACLPEQWKALAGADRSKVISGNALVAQGHQMDVNAIVAFANAMPELLDKLETAEAVENTLNGELKARDDTIELLHKENDRLRQPRCINEPAGDPCKFCGAREATDVCRDGTYHIIRERDAARAELERLKLGGLG